MTKRNLSTSIQNALDFKGFDDLVELFKAGEQTDSLGNTNTFTTDDLDDMVSNHASFPIVVGHPKADDPAYGWSVSLSRDGDSLYGKFTDVDPDFSSMVENKRFPNRSVRLRKTDNGFTVAHVGFLGAAAPAVKGLKQLQFSEDENLMEFEFSSYADTVMARMLRRMREFFIDKYSVEDADKVMPEWELETLTEEAARERVEENQSTSHFNEHQNEGDTDVPKTYTQEQVDELLGKKDTDFASSEKDYKSQLSTERATRLTADFTSFVSGAVDDGKLTPAMAAGMCDFMLQLDATADFEFSQGEGNSKKETKTNGVAWFKDFVNGLGKTVSLGASEDDDDEATGSTFSAPAGTTVDADRLALEGKANAYMQKHDVDFVEAVIAVGG